MEQWEVDARVKCNFTKNHTKKKGKVSFDTEALRIWSLIVRLRGNGCELCGKYPDLDKLDRPVKGMDAHHILSKKRKLFRFNLNNGVCVCKGCHMYSDKHSPHFDSLSFEGFMTKMCTKDHLKDRYLWYEDHKYDKDEAKTAEHHYYRLLDIYVDMLDGVVDFPME